MMPHSSGPLFWRFAQAGVQMLNNTRLREIRDNSVVVENKEGVVNDIPADTVVLANVLGPNNKLAKDLKGKVDEVVVIGDAAEVSNVFHANNDGAKAGLEI
jgi:thioredoxin reductase